DSRVARLAPSENPNGIPSQSPGLRAPRRSAAKAGGTSYPGKTSEENHNPNGVVANVTRPPDENGIAGTALRLMICWTMTQGSSFLATLGWRTQSLWDCSRARSRIVRRFIV